MATITLSTLNRSRAAAIGLALVTVLVSVALPTTAALIAAPPADASFEQLRALGEQAFEKKSYATALKMYDQAAALPDLDETERRWTLLRRADCRWRSEASSRTTDTSVFDQCRKELEGLIAAIERAPDRDLVWAEAQEALGDFWWTRQSSTNWGQGWPRYQAALDYWSGSSDLELAAGRYLAIVRNMAQPPWQQHHQTLGSHIPIDVLDRALQIAPPAERPFFNYMLAGSLRNRHANLRDRERLEQCFAGALKSGAASPWYDDALYLYAQWLGQQGRLVQLPQGQWRTEPDYVRAVAMYRRLLKEFRPGQSQYVDNARRLIDQITSPQLGVQVSNHFLPGSEIEYHLSWRNVDRIDFALIPVDLTEDADFNRQPGQGHGGIAAWLQQIDLDSIAPARRWTSETEDTGEHRPGAERKRLDEPLPMGAYVLRATAAEASATELILVTDIGVVVKAGPDRTIVYCCDARSGAPIEDAAVRAWSIRQVKRNRWSVDNERRSSGGDGLCEFKDRPRGSSQFIAARLGNRQAIATVGTPAPAAVGGARWEFYAFTDRPAYRPEETVEWKVIGRRPGGGGFATPAGLQVSYLINDPRGSKAHEGTLVLNDFGSGWGTLDLDPSMTLGEYTLVLTFPVDGGGHSSISRTLFRLEEYKLPEFKVAVKTPTKDGQSVSYRLGETVSAEILAEYYFGGPVAGAAVEAVVYQKPFHHFWQPPREFAWCRERVSPRHSWYGPGQVLVRQSLVTDAEGRATVRFDTPPFNPQDLEYRIEARVTDASRREVSATSSVKVTRQRYYAHLRAPSRLHRPKDKVEIEIKTIDANQQPVAVTGSVAVTREQWREIWIDPTGREISGETLAALRSGGVLFPVPSFPGDGWRLKFRGYETTEIDTQAVRTDGNGEATYSFLAPEEGFYRVRWRSPDTLDSADEKDPAEAPRDWITAETMVWVATETTKLVGSHHGGVEIIADKDTFKVGQTAPIMIATPTNNQHVLFTVEGSRLYDAQVVAVAGNVKLIQLPITEPHIPNVFLNATLVTDGQLLVDQEEVVVPPLEQSLNITITPDRSEYEPGESGTLQITATDHDGRPVAAELAVGLVDESVYAIQDEYAGDPREHFFSGRQRQNVWLASTLTERPYTTLAEIEDEGTDGTLSDAKGDFERDDDSVNGFRARKAAVGGSMSRDMLSVADAPMESMKQRSAEMEEGMSAPMAQAPGVGGGDAAPEIKVRRDFRSTILWLPEVITDETGTATVDLKYADSLTGWRATARGTTTVNQFGLATAVTRTKKPLIARLQAPRFFVAGDTVTISGVLNNNTDQPMTVNAHLAAEGLTLLGVSRDGRVSEGASSTVVIEPQRDARVDWQVQVQRPGAAELTLTAASSESGSRHSDGMVKRYPVAEHGIEKLLAKSVKLRGEDVTVAIDLPAARRDGSTAMTVQVTASLAVTMLDALPYLIDYPYGCTEQTMSRFLPTAIVARTLSDLKLDPEIAMSRVFGGVESKFAHATHPKGKKNLAEMEAMVDSSLERLYDMQHGDGGWGWWKQGDSDRFMTAYVLWGLALAKEAGVDVDAAVLEQAASYLDRQLVEEEFTYDRQAWMLHALATHHAVMKRTKMTESASTALENLFAHRQGLNAYTRALTALSAHRYDDDDKALILADNLANGVQLDDSPDTSVILRRDQEAEPAVMATAHWGEDGLWWRWSDGGVEATAFALRALLAIDPNHELIEPAMNWLLKNRRGAQWSNTRDTAIVVLAMNDYLKHSGELETELDYELSVNGNVVETKSVGGADALSAPSRVTINPQLLVDGRNEIRIRRTGGHGSLYINGEVTFFSEEVPITAAGNEIFIRRDYYRLVPRPTLFKGVVEERIKLNDEDYLVSGERVEVILTVETKNNYEYLVFEDLKPAGLEATQLKSGEAMYARELKSASVDRVFERQPGAMAVADREHGTNDRRDFTGRQRWVHQELRDRKVACFVDALPQGVWEMRYELRAEVPGRFHALPTLGHAMYVPEIRCNGDEVRMTVQDSE